MREPNAQKIVRRRRELNQLTWIRIFSHLVPATVLPRARNGGMPSVACVRIDRSAWCLSRAHGARLASLVSTVPPTCLRRDELLQVADGVILAVKSARIRTERLVSHRHRSILRQGMAHARAIRASLLALDPDLLPEPVVQHNLDHGPRALLSQPLRAPAVRAGHGRAIRADASRRGTRRNGAKRLGTRAICDQHHPSQDGLRILASGRAMADELGAERTPASSSTTGLPPFDEARGHAMVSEARRPTTNARARRWIAGGGTRRPTD